MTVNDIYRQIALLSKEKEYTFRNNSNRNTFRFVKKNNATQALHFVRISNGETSNVTVSDMNLKKIASKVRPYIPFQIDVIVGASGNWRSLFESALAYTPQFYACVINRQRHLVWAPEHQHEQDVLCVADDDLLKLFSKQSRFYDFRYFIDNCYPFDNCYEDFNYAFNDLLKIFRHIGKEIYSIYDISEATEISELIDKSEEYSYQALHSSIKTNSNFSLYDIAISYKKFLLAKQYFANY